VCRSEALLARASQLQALQHKLETQQTPVIKLGEEVKMLQRRKGMQAKSLEKVQATHEKAKKQAHRTAPHRTAPTPARRACGGQGRERGGWNWYLPG